MNKFAYVYGNPDNKKLNVKKVILETIKIAGLISMTMVAPNAIQSLKLLDGNKEKYRRWYVDKTIEKMTAQKLVVIKNNGNIQRIVSLTDKGEKLLDRYEMQELFIVKPKKWDGNYRVVIFDIREGKRKIRDDLRIWLEDLGFVRLQNSVWVFPYECREVVVLLKSRLGVGTEVLYLIVENIENDLKLKKHFGL